MHTLPLIFAFGFAHPLMLGWLAAAAVPIIIHLWRRRRYRETSFAAMEFLLAATRRRGRRIVFQQRLLAALRASLLVLLTLAAAQPYWSSTGPNLYDEPVTHHIIVIDGSFSMDYKTNGRSRFEYAKLLAKELVEKSRPDDLFSLVLMSSATRVLTSSPLSTRETILQKIQSLRPTHSPADLSDALRVLEQLAIKTKTGASLTRRTQIVFFTDLQRTTWLPKLSQIQSQALQRRFVALAKHAALLIRDVGAPDANNLAVTKLIVSPPLIIAGRQVVVQATIRNFGDQTLSKQSVELLVDRRSVSNKIVELPANAEITVKFPYQFHSPGDHRVEIRAPGDKLELDNQRFLAVTVRRKIRVLCVSDSSADTATNAAYYLIKALSARENPQQPALIQAEKTTTSALTRQDLSRYDCLMLCNVAQFSPLDAQMLHDYLLNGGNLVFFLGDRVLADKYNKELGGEKKTDHSGRAGQGRILPARLENVVTQEPLSRLDPLGFQHPILRAFRGQGKTGLLTTPVYKYFRLVRPKDSSARVILKTAAGDPLMLEERIGQGTVVLVATSADASWTAMPIWPSFLPLVRETLTFCLNRSEESRLNYQWPFAVNLDPRESDLARVSLNQLRKEVLPGVEFSHSIAKQTMQPSKNISPLPLGQGQGVSAYRPSIEPSPQSAALSVNLLYVLLCLLLLETFFAWRFGHQNI
ncbi:MAG: VWA domain-containing protein [Thermoguttaceae bacterium]